MGVGIGDLKSAGQKYIRREEIGKALNIIERVWPMGQQAQIGFVKRLPMIAVEDCGWAKTWVIDEAMQQLEAPNKNVVRRLVYALAKGPKDKDACGLYDKAMGQGLFYNEEPEEKALKLAKALENGDEMLAARLVMSVSDKGVASWWVWPVLLGATQYLDAQNVLVAMRKRLQMGWYGCDKGLTLCCAVQMVIRRKTEEFDVPTGDLPEIVKSPLDWHCQDMHTGIGKATMAFIAKKHGITSKKLDALWFNVESARVNALKPQKWFDNWEFCFRRDIGIGAEQAAKEWAVLKPDVERFVNWKMNELGVR